MGTSTGGMAPFEQMADDIRRQIRSGSLRAGDKLPSHRDLATKYNVAPNTVQKAMRLLTDEGWVEARGPIGSFVSGSWTEQPPRLTLDQVVSELSALRERVERLEGRSP